jgi:translation initiation factor 2B subunit (eIF-2B alpha/beta/delta family)
MPQIKVVLKDAEFDFVENHLSYGFKSKTELVNKAISAFRKQLREKAIAESAELYQEIYEQDEELRELTNDAASLCLE